MNREALNDLHAVRFRSKGYPGKQLLNKDQERNFSNFLVRALGENVFVISTRLGLDVYYLSDSKRTKFIVQNFWLFQAQGDGSHPPYHSTEYSGSAVLGFFDQAVTLLSQHPQLFLSCCKRLIVKFNQAGTHTLLNQMLYTCFNNQLNRLISDDRVPFAAKIKQLLDEKEHIFLKPDNAVRHLLKDFTLRNTTN